MRQRFSIKNPERLRDIQWFPNAVQLMMSLEAIRASMRWLSGIPRNSSVSSGADQVAAISAGMGWSAEAFRQIRDGAVAGWLKREMLGDNNSIQELWDDVTGKNPSLMLRKFHRVRDKYFGHWDIELAKSFVEKQVQGRHSEPFIESDGQGKFLSTRYIWAHAAFFHDLADDPEDLMELGELISSILRMLGTAANMIAQLLSDLIRQTPIEFELVPEALDQSSQSDRESTDSDPLGFWDRPEEDIYSVDDGEPV